MGGGDGGARVNMVSADRLSEADLNAKDAFSRGLVGSTRRGKAGTWTVGDRSHTVLDCLYAMVVS